MHFPCDPAPTRRLTPSALLASCATPVRRARRHTRTARLPRRGAPTPAVLAAVLALAAPLAPADEFFIPDGDVNGLINALVSSNADPDPDIIHLAEGGTYTLATSYVDFRGGNALPIIISQITINGHGATVQRSAEPDTPQFRAIQVRAGDSFPDDDGDLTLLDTTIAACDVDGDGGAIHNLDGALRMEDCFIIGNVSADDGGGIFNDGTMSLTRCVLGGNTAPRGGGIAEWGESTLIDCTISDNTATVSEGGGVFRLRRSGTAGVMTAHNSTFSGNSAARSGGGVRVQSGTFEATNCTFSGNSTGLTGGGIYNNGATMRLTNCTLAGNATAGDEGGGILNTGSGFTLSNSIVAGSSGGGDIEGHPYNDAGHNIVEDGSGLSDPTSMSGDPRLAPLADNGGPTLTHALLAGSIAIDRGDCAGGQVLTDQRSEDRPKGRACDIGAFESDETACPPDINGDGTVNTQDFLAYLNLWAAGDPAADWNGDATVNTQDFLAYLNDWAAAMNNGGQCP